MINHISFFAAFLLFSFSSNSLHEEMKGVPCYDQYEKAMIRANEALGITMQVETFVLKSCTATLDFIGTFKSLSAFSKAVETHKAQVTKISKEFCDCVQKRYGKTAPGC